MKNPRLALAGLLAIAAGVILFVYFQNNQEGASDPVQLMRVVGQVAGAIAGIGLALIVMSFFITPRRRR
jgi:drug/metabolite transporter (DMT)-like permease